MSIKTKIMASNVGRKFAKNKPEIYFGLGVACGLGAIGASFYAGTKAKYILETTKKEVNEVKYVWEIDEVSKETYSERLPFSSREKKSAPFPIFQQIVITFIIYYGIVTFA